MRIKARQEDSPVVCPRQFQKQREKTKSIDGAGTLSEKELWLELSLRSIAYGDATEGSNSGDAMPYGAFTQI